MDPDTQSGIRWDPSVKRVWEGGRMTDEHNFLWMLESFPCTLHGIIYFKKVNPKMKPKILC